MDRIEELNKRFQGKEPEKVLAFFLVEYPKRIAFATSMGYEDQVLVYMISEIDPLVKIFTLDTGRLFPETYDLIQMTNGRYKARIDLIFPDAGQVEKMVNHRGVNLFYESQENRELCCGVRKNEPLKRALQGFDAWICGLRKEQSVHRRDTRLIEWDTQHNMMKVNPLVDWTSDRVWQYIREHEIPYNVLHDKGFYSIGCQPCTRAILPGEDFRSGRWWWEVSDHKECGIHRRPGRE